MTSNMETENALSNGRNGIGKAQNILRRSYFEE